MYIIVGVGSMFELFIRTNAMTIVSFLYLILVFIFYNLKGIISRSISIEAEVRFLYLLFILLLFYVYYLVYGYF